MCYSAIVLLVDLLDCDSTRTVVSVSRISCRHVYKYLIIYIYIYIYIYIVCVCVCACTNVVGWSGQVRWAQINTWWRLKLSYTVLSAEVNGQQIGGAVIAKVLCWQ